MISNGFLAPTNQECLKSRQDDSICLIGETRQFQDVCIELAKRLGLETPYDSTLDFIKQSCSKSGVDYEYLRTHGVWHDPKAKPKYLGYRTEVSAEAYEKDSVIYDEKTGVYWDWKKSTAQNESSANAAGYTETKDAYKGYIGQRIGDKIHVGFKPDKLNKSGKFEIYSELLKKKGFSPMPAWVYVPEYEKMGKDQLVLLGFKVAIQTHSRTQNCKWLTEIYHDNPALINTATAAELGLKDGDRIKVKSTVSEITTKLKTIEGIVPGVIGISFHCGHWEYGRYASGKKSSEFAQDEKQDPDLKLKWWKEKGMHPNWIIPNSSEPISGQWRMNDAIVSVSKA